jgi:hypothetical protein
MWPVIQGILSTEGDVGLGETRNTSVAGGARALTERVFSPILAYPASHGIRFSRLASVARAVEQHALWLRSLEGSSQVRPALGL